MPNAEYVAGQWRNDQYLDLRFAHDMDFMSIQEYMRLDFDNDGVVTDDDALNVGAHLNQNGTVEINSDSVSKTLVFKNTTMDRETSIGAMGINTSNAYVKNLFADYLVLSSGAMLLGISPGQYKKVYPVGGYDLDHKYEVGADDSDISRTHMSFYVDDLRTGWVDLLADPNQIYVRSYGSDRPVTILQDDGTNFIIQTGSATYTINHNGSDKRLKKDIKNTEIKNALDIINKIEHKSFTWKATDEHKKIGYIAQQLKELDDSLVIEVKQPEESKYDNLYQLDINSLMALSTKAIQELSKENQELKNKLNELEKRIKKLEEGK